MPSGLQEELALARVTAEEYRQLALDLWRERYYARAREYQRKLAEEREHIARLEAQLETETEA
jgi:bacterioferritin (cytochrome b1)